MDQDKKIDYSKRSLSLNQRLWNYIRRNPIFRIADIMMICDVKSEYFQNYIRKLENAEYIVFAGKTKKPYSSREYKLIKNNGVNAPFISYGKLYDYDEKDKTSPYHYSKKKTKKYPKNLEKLLKAISNKEMTLKELSLNSDIKLEEIGYWLKHLKQSKIISGMVLNENVSRQNRNKYKIKNGFRLYAFDLEKKKALLERLNGGAYIRIPKMRHLWIL